VNHQLFDALAAFAFWIHCSIFASSGFDCNRCLVIAVESLVEAPALLRQFDLINQIVTVCVYEIADCLPMPAAIPASTCS
jgi:hypothetical protein